MPSEPSPDPSDARRGTARRAASRRLTSRAAAEHLLVAAAAGRPQDLPPATVALHREILRYGPRRRARRRWDTTTAALVAAASIDAAAEPIITALRLEGTARSGDGPPLHAVVEPARHAVALAAGWAWCAMLCQLPDDVDAFRWTAGAGRATQRTFARDGQARLSHRIDGAVGQACRSLVAAATRSSDADARVDRLAPARLAVAIGGLGAAYELLAASESR